MPLPVNYPVIPHYKGATDYSQCPGEWSRNSNHLENEILSA